MGVPDRKVKVIPDRKHQDHCLLPPVGSAITAMEVHNLHTWTIQT